MALIAGARDDAPVRGLTHGFYKIRLASVPDLSAPPFKHSRSLAISASILMLAVGLRSSRPWSPAGTQLGST